MIARFDYKKNLLSQCYLILIACICFSVASCGGKVRDTSESSDLSDDVKYKDGTYCADVSCYNPNTGTNKTYTLNVEVENKELVKIIWRNGGWLDDSHFIPQEIATDGSCSFTSDKGHRYTVEITGSECSFTSEEVSLEGDDEPRQFTLTLEQCAASIKMTENELSEYESTFNVSRSKILTEEMCRLMFEYVQKKRELDGKRRSLENLIENGYIQKTHSIGTDGNIGCQTLIVKRRGHYYLLEVQGSNKATMGLMDFDPSVNDWQEVKIMQDPGYPEWQFFYIRIIDESSEMTSLDEKMQTFCTY